MGMAESCAEFAESEQVIAGGHVGGMQPKVSAPSTDTAKPLQK